MRFAAGSIANQKDISIFLYVELNKFVDGLVFSWDKVGVVLESYQGRFYSFVWSWGSVKLEFCYWYGQTSVELYFYLLEELALEFFGLVLGEAWVEGPVYAP